MKKEPWIIKNENEISVREVTLDVGMSGTPIKILQLTDIHFHAINDQDSKENHELVMASYDDLTWLKDGASVPRLKRCFEAAGEVDQIVITGDTLSYLSHGGLELLKKHIFDPYPDALVCMGNHDSLRCWNAKVDEVQTQMERHEILKKHWIHDIYYTSKVIDGRVMVIQLDDASLIDYGKGGFWDFQIEPFANDLALARDKGYAVLLFYHVPIATRDPRYRAVESCTSHGGVENYCDPSKHVLSCENGAAKRFMDLVARYSDVIKGAFCGHMHGDYYTEFTLTDENGVERTVPQYVVTAMPYDKGSYLMLTVQ